MRTAVLKRGRGFGTYGADILIFVMGCGDLARDCEEN